MESCQLIGNMLIMLTAAFTLYLSAVMIRRINSVVLKRSYIKVFRYELIACVLFILLALDIRFGFWTNLNHTALNTAGRILRDMVILAVAGLLFIAGKITVSSLIRSAGTAQKAIVLGLALENGKPTKDLLSRLDAAEKYLQQNPGSMLILTGGNPDESGKTEAAVMRDLLTGRGVAEDRMILEDQAETTKENFRNTAQLIDPRDPVVLISSDYHMDRAVRTAKKAGFSSVLRRPARSPFVLFGANVMWETVLEVNELTLKQ